MRMRYAALAATAMLLAALAATILLTSNAAPQPISVAQQPSEDSPRDAPATPVTPQPPDRCATATATDCILAVYKGAPDNYAQIQDIPDSLLIQPDEDGRYQIERGQQVTVITAAQLPEGYTRFDLQARPVTGQPPTTDMRLIPPLGTTYTFTLTTDFEGSILIAFDLAAAKPPPQPGLKPQLGDTVVSTVFFVDTTKFRYDTLDITGAATTPGSYAFLKTTGVASSAIGNFSASAYAGVELRIHPTDASATSRTAFYDTVQVGDRFDYRTNGLRCGFRFKVTSVGATASPKTLGIEIIRAYGGSCGGFVDDPGAAMTVDFVWGVRPGIPGADGLRVLIRNEPTGPGSYRLGEGGRCVIDVPVGMQVIYDSHVLLAPSADAPPDAPRRVITLLDAETGAQLNIDSERCRGLGRTFTSPEVHASFDQIIASLRVK